MDSHAGVGACDGAGTGEREGEAKEGKREGESDGGWAQPLQEKVLKGYSHVHVGCPGSVNQPSVQLVLNVPQISTCLKISQY